MIGDQNPKGKKITVLFQPSGRRGKVESGLSVLQAAQELGISLESVCGGKRACGKCIVRLEETGLQNGISGSGEKMASAFSLEEAKFLTETEQKEGYRLACATWLTGDAMVFVPAQSLLKPQVIRKEAGKFKAALAPGIKTYYVEMRPPSLEDPLGDFERLQKALQAAHGLANFSMDPISLQTLPRKLRAADWKVTAFLWMGREILEVLPGRVLNFFGLALDIGTTTIAAYLCNLANGQVVATDSVMNPQVTFGEDVMSRISYAAMNPEDGLRRMKEVLRDELNRLIQSTVDLVDLHPKDILELTVVGNTVMHHIFLGIDPQYVGLAPFPPVVHRPLDIKARDLGLEVHAAANVHVLPLEAGFVGADNVGVLISQEPYRKKEMTLIIDVGTNGELLLGNCQRLLSASCATGPAFEGAHIKFGMRAAPGAIQRVGIDAQTLEVRYQVVGREKWSDAYAPSEIQARGLCGSGIIDAVAGMFKAGVIDSTGRFRERSSHPRLRKTEKGPEFVIARAPETAFAQDIVISLADIRAVQLAKGALYAGAKILMQVLQVDRLDRVLLAGGFGSYIDPQNALVLGMFPDCDLKNVLPVGNAAGEGACQALLDRRKRAEAARMARRVEYIELTAYPEFAKEFAQAMYFPHGQDAFPHLAPAFNPDIRRRDGIG